MLVSWKWFIVVVAVVVERSRMWIYCSIVVQGKRKQHSGMLAVVMVIIVAVDDDADDDILCAYHFILTLHNCNNVTV